MRARFIPCPSSTRGNNTTFNNATELSCQTILGPRKEWRCVASSCYAYPFEYSASLCVSTITDRLTLLWIHLTKFNNHALLLEWFHPLDNKLREVWVRARIGFGIYSKLVCVGIFSIIRLLLLLLLFLLAGYD